jgi:hypothetical protein
MAWLWYTVELAAPVVFDNPNRLEALLFSEVSLYITLNGMVNFMCQLD